MWGAGEATKNVVSGWLVGGGAASNFGCGFYFVVISVYVFRIFYSPLSKHNRLLMMFGGGLLRAHCTFTIVSW